MGDDADLVTMVTEDSVVPSYLNKNWRAVEASRQKEKFSRLYHNQRASKQELPKWKVCDVDYNQWRSNVIDQKTLYSEQKSAFRPNSEETFRQKLDDVNASLSNQDNVSSERLYVRQHREEAGSPSLQDEARFTKQILTEYRKPNKKQTTDPFYGSSQPHNPTKINSFADVLREVVRPHSSIKLMNKMLNTGNIVTKCDRSNTEAKQFCDVLGPVACNRCIEATNKRIARAVERAAFPEIDCSVQSLIAPKLAKKLLQGQKVKQRKAGRSGVKTGFSLPEIPHQPKMGYSYALPGLQRKVTLATSKQTLLPSNRTNTKWSKAKYCFLGK